MTASASVCFLCGALQTSSSNLGFDSRYSFRGLFVNSLNCDKILLMEGLSLQSYRSPSVTRILLLLLQTSCLAPLLARTHVFLQAIHFP